MRRVPQNSPATRLGHRQLALGQGEIGGTGPLRPGVEKGLCSKATTTTSFPPTANMRRWPPSTKAALLLALLALNLVQGSVDRKVYLLLGDSGVGKTAQV